MRATIAILAWATVGTAGCGACKDDKPAAKQPPPRTASVTPRPGTPARRPDPRKASVGSTGSGAPGVMANVTVEELTPVVPTVAGATLFSPPSQSPHGEQVHLAWCITAADQATALAAVKRGLTDGGWSEIHDRGQGPRIAITGDHPPYRLAASISSAPREGCSPADGKWFASVSMYKIASVTRPPVLDEPGAGSAVVR